MLQKMTGPIFGKNAPKSVIAPNRTLVHVAGTVKCSVVADPVRYALLSWFLVNQIPTVTIILQ